MTTDRLPREFAADWVASMLVTVLGTDSTAGVAGALGDLDRRSGDGDFGTNLTSAFTRVRAETEPAPQDYRGWLTAVSRGYLGTGGTSGPLFGMYFRDLARCTEAEAPTLGELAEGFARGVATVQRYGKAQVGHKTMVDAMVPAADELRRQADAGASPVDALAAAADAAWAGAESTRDITAKRGRASYVGEVARGVLDPGAVAVAVIVACAAGAVRGESGRLANVLMADVRKRVEEGGREIDRSSILSDRDADRR